MKQAADVERSIQKFLNRELQLRKVDEYQDAEIVTMAELRSPKISYDRMQGRPSIVLKIFGQELECLLDTGARVNVMSEKVRTMLRVVDVEPTEDRLRCANNSHLEILGKIFVPVQVCEMVKMVEFIVVKTVSPDVIGGVDLQNNFGFSLRWMHNISEPSYNFVCSLEARFGRTIDRQERLRRAKAHLGKEGDSKLETILNKYADVFMADNWDVGCTKWVKHEIKTTGGPINIKPWRQPVHLEEKIKETVKNLFQNNIIKRCNSPWNSPMVCVWKKEKNDIRLCLDFRQLNLITSRPAFPMPNAEEMLESVAHSRWFSSFDLGNAYYQVELEEESKLKTAFSTKDGQYCFNRMPFGIAAAPGTFQELMTKVLYGIKGAMAYLDDILIYSRNKEEHMRTLELVLDRILEAGLRLNPEKCKIFQTEIKFLGHILNADGVQTDPTKIEAIRMFGRPKCMKNLRSFLGICNYYRRFIKNYSQKSRLLEGMCGKSMKKLVWSEQSEQAFEELKRALTEAPILGLPDLSKDFILDTDASFDALGAVLSQKDEFGQEKVIAYGSHAMNKHELGYCVTRKELLAIYFFCIHFKHYLYGKRFTLRTDHKAITFMLSTKKPITPQFQSWINYISSLDMQLKYRKGSEHTNADMLSRRNCTKCSQCLMEHEDPKLEKVKTRQLTAIENDKGEMDPTFSERKQIKKEIPDDEKVVFISKIHHLLAHANAEKVAKYIKDNYSMRQLWESVKEVVSKCEPCQKSKSLTIPTKESTVELKANELFEKVYADICGPFQHAKSGRKYILGIIDRFSRYVRLIPIASQDEATLSSKILDEWILKFGAPKELHVDCGKGFDSKKMKSLTTDVGTELHLSSPYHHNTNGLIERRFRTLRECMSATLKQKGTRDWERILPEIEFAMNATCNKSTGKSPAELLFGKKIFREGWFSKIKPEDRQTTPGNNTRRQFKVGDTVLIKKEVRSKGDDKYDGPFRIVQKIHDRRYLLQDDDGRRLERNVEKLRQFLKEGDVR